MRRPVAAPAFSSGNRPDSALYYCIGWAVSTWFDRPQHIVQLRAHAMAQNFDWATSAQQYVSVYQHALRKKLAATFDAPSVRLAALPRPRYSPTHSDA